MLLPPFAPRQPMLPRCGNFDIILDHFSRFSRPCVTPHAPCGILYADWMLIGGCDPMLWPISRRLISGGKTFDREAPSRLQVFMSTTFPKALLSPVGKAFVFGFSLVWLGLSIWAAPKVEVGSW